MQQRLNNRWLSPRLLESAHERSNAQKKQRRTASDRSTAGKSGKTTLDAHSSRAAPYQTTKRSHRRTWQRVASGLLLIGSAAFSYLAWSQSGAGAQVFKLQMAGGPDSVAAAPMMPAERTPTADKRSSESLTRGRVHALRVENRALQLRITQLQADIENSAP